MSRFFIHLKRILDMYVKTTARLTVTVLEFYIPRMFSVGFSSVGRAVGSCVAGQSLLGGPIIGHFTTASAPKAVVCIILYMRRCQLQNVSPRRAVVGMAECGCM